MAEDRSQERRKHVFVINGAPEFLDVVRELFQEERYNVTTTNFVPNSFAQIEALAPDALIVDIVLGQQAGWELLEQLHEAAATTGIPVLVVSTSADLLDRGVVCAGLRIRPVSCVVRCCHRLLTRARRDGDVRRVRRECPG